MTKNKKRQIILSALLFIVFVSVWWVQIFSPLDERSNELNDNYELVMQKRDRIKLKIQELSKAGGESQQTDKEVALFNSLLVDGKNIEEVNAYTQILFQKLVESKEILLKSYKEQSSLKWRDYQVGIVQLNMQTTISGLSDLLEYIESLKQVIRIELLTVDYTLRRSKSINVSLRLGTLFVKKT